MIFWNFETPITLMACCLWNLCEYCNLPLGKLAPHVFGLAIGRKPNKKISHDQDR